MSDDIAAQVRELQTRIEASQRARIKAEHERDAAVASVERVQQHLQQEFGVSTVENAQTVLTQLKDELGAALQHVRTSLDHIGE